MGRRMRSSWGSVSEVRRGVWRLRYWAETPEGYRRCSETVRGTRKAAEDRLAAIRLDHSHDAPAPTIGDVWRRWYLPDLERLVASGERAASTLAAYRGAWGLHVEPRWADVPCDQVRPLEVQQWLTPMGASEAEAAMRILRPLADYAVRYGACETNPFRVRYLMPSKSTIERRDAGIWTLGQLGEVWQAVRGEWFEGAFLLAGFCGLRVGEALGVMGADVEDASRDVPLALVRVRRQVTHAGGVSETLKNSQSVRVVAVAGPVAPRLLALADGRGWVSSDGLGGHNTQKRLMASWRSSLEGTGLHHPFRNLRNSYQTWMRWDARVEPYFIETMMGHKVAGVTGAHYDRPVAEMLADVVADAYRARPYDAGWGTN